MEPLKITDLEKIVKADNPKIAIHVFIFEMFNKFGYEETQLWIRRALNEWLWTEYGTIKEYLLNRIFDNEQFEPYKEYLFSIMLGLSAKELDGWVHKMSNNGFSKQMIYDILGELFVYIQFNPTTKENDDYYDLLADFLDGFTSWGSRFRILPDEPDCIS